MQYIPIVVEQTLKGERSYDIFSRLLKDRIVILNGTIDDNVSSLVISQLLFLEAENCNEDIYLYINSPGGMVTSGLAIYDTMQYIKADVRTICIGQACSMGSFLLAAGTNGKRFALLNARIMIHQPLGSFRGQVTDIQIQAKEILKLKNKLNLLLANHTGNTLKKIKHDVERDFFMSTNEAIKYGIIDNVLIKKNDYRK